jgi:nucleoside 2-deoxyribosyltransferase
MLRVFVSGPFEEQQLAREWRNFLQDQGYQVQSGWLDEPAVAAEDLTDEHKGLLATRDLDDLDDCDVLVAINPESYRRGGTGGRHVELGYALALGKPVFVIGVKSNIYHSYPGVDWAKVAEGSNDFLAKYDSEFLLLDWLNSVCVRIMAAL